MTIPKKKRWRGSQGVATRAHRTLPPGLQQQRRTWRSAVGAEGSWDFITQHRVQNLFCYLLCRQPQVSHLSTPSVSFCNCKMGRLTPVYWSLYNNNKSITGQAPNMIVTILQRQKQVQLSHGHIETPVCFQNTSRLLTLRRY